MLICTHLLQNNRRKRVPKCVLLDCVASCCTVQTHRPAHKFQTPSTPSTQRPLGWSWPQWASAQLCVGLTAANFGPITLWMLSWDRFFSFNAAEKQTPLYVLILLSSSDILEIWTLLISKCYTWEIPCLKNKLQTPATHSVYSLCKFSWMNGSMEISKL